MFSFSFLSFLIDVSFLAEVLNIEDKKRLGILKEMIKVKHVDQFQYNELIGKLFSIPI